MLERQQRDLLAPKTPKSTTPAPATTTPGDVNGIGRLADPTKIEDVVDEDNAYAVFVGNFYETDIRDDEMRSRLAESLNFFFKNRCVKCFMSPSVTGYCEIYNNYVYDLLEEVSREDF